MFYFVAAKTYLMYRCCNVLNYICENELERQICLPSASLFANGIKEDIYWNHILGYQTSAIMNRVLYTFMLL